MCGLRFQLLGIVLSIALCLAVREQQQQQKLLQEEREEADDVDSTLLKKNARKRLDHAEPAE